MGVGMMFLASGCGAVLTDEQREYLANLKPNEFYPLDELLNILEATQRTRPELVRATGRRWGNAVKDEIAKRGATTAKEALRLICSVYQEHHQGDVGELVVEDDGEEAIILTNRGPYPSSLIAGAFEAMLGALGADDVELEEAGSPERYRLSWHQEDSA
jgi:hypothetical protein